MCVMLSIEPFILSNNTTVEIKTYFPHLVHVNMLAVSQLRFV